MNRSEAGRIGWLKTQALHEARNQAAMAAYLASPKKCRLCSATIEYRKKANDYCSRSCAAAYNNGRRNENIAEHPCDVCGEMIKSRKKRNCCSKSCRSKSRWLKTKSLIEKTGIITVKDDSTGRRTAKKFLIEKRGRRCEICENTEWMGQPIPLVLDHIDGNSEHNNLEKLRLVCGNCNMQLPTFAGRNKGNGRAWRRERYAKGLSS